MSCDIGVRARFGSELIKFSVCRKWKSNQKTPFGGYNIISEYDLAHIFTCDIVNDFFRGAPKEIGDNTELVDMVLSREQRLPQK